jgi:formylglycine-generating enzyme required for sulfatase activity
MVKKSLISFFSLLLFAAAAATATAQAAKPKLAVFVVGMDDWMLADVLAHLAGEELNRDKTFEVVTRSNHVQNKLKALRRSKPSGAVDHCDLRDWSIASGVAHVYLITTLDNQNFSAQLFDVATISMASQCSRSSTGSFGAVALKQLAWTLTGGLRSGAGCPNICALPGMVFVQGGTYTMGNLSGRDNAVSDGGTAISAFTAHPVTVGDFWIGDHEVTQGEWLSVMGSFPTSSITGSSRGDDKPMIYVSWNDVQNYLSALNGSTAYAYSGMTYRLPTEEEWEYAARGGVKMHDRCGKGCQYSGSNTLNQVAVYNGSWSYSYPAAVKTKMANELGIYDMSGSVCEWCSDGWRSDYTSTPNTSYRVLRGGSWDNNAWDCRVAYRGNRGPGSRDNYVGFRVV